MIFRRKRKVVKGTEIIKDISELDFLSDLNKLIKDFQDNGCMVDVQYVAPYHALIIAYEVK